MFNTASPLTLIREALANENELTYPEHLQEAPSDKVLGRLTPQLQSLYLLHKQLKEERDALEQTLEHEPGECMICAAIKRQFVVWSMLQLALEEKFGADQEFTIYANWAVIGENPFENHPLFQSFRRLQETFHGKPVVN